MIVIISTINGGSNKMKFIVSKTSDFGDSKPCDEAKESTFTRVDTRAVDCPSKLQFPSDELWLQEGENHRIVDGEITRDFPGQLCWVVEIDSLEELVEFMDRQEVDLILSREPDVLENIPTIELYDDYRE